MTPQRPAMVTGAIWLAAGVIAAAGLTALMTVVFEDELVRAWAADRSDSGAVEPPAFVPVAVTMFVVVALLAVVLISFFRDGHNWARVVLSAVVALVGVATLAILRTNPPALFLAVAVVSLVVDLAAVGALWHPDTRAFCRRAAVDSSADTSAR
jgi:O-antigen/teichoic acid export membrane protein